MSDEQSYIMIKPDGVQRGMDNQTLLLQISQAPHLVASASVGLVAEIIKRFEQRGYTLKGLKMLNVTRATAEVRPR